MPHPQPRMKLSLQKEQGPAETDPALRVVRRKLLSSTQAVPSFCSALGHLRRYKIPESSGAALHKPVPGSAGLQAVA